MPSLAFARAANCTFTPKAPPVAVFLGGTSGIGQAICRALAHYTRGNTHVVICGRNRSSADATLTSLPGSAQPNQREFISCDATLMRSVEDTTSSLLSGLQKVNFLVLSPGFMNLRGRDESPEGIDKRLALNYYARWKFIQDLMPLLRKARDNGEDASVMTVLAPGTGWKIDLDDLGLKKSYSAFKALSAVPTYNDLMIERFAEREPGLSFAHAFPGIVRTPLLGRLPSLLLYPITVSPEDCAEYLLYALLTGGPGAHRVDNKAGDMGKRRYFGSDEARERLWEHTVEEIRRALTQWNDLQA
ncbi:NAD(P)-binding protein [Wolfiporia cocos MD-104 SS10]|uniref:NAD(P)-binding protein n=1 Tax=Wolfiporia cocos (strain MD-104) TaxID=742152 RepID=A0A2H3IYG5_WOLCO|nr:NAD(P)-binding protein [Wolfiporia cocos MD-104 SS10]